MGENFREREREREEREERIWREENEDKNKKNESEKKSGMKIGKKRKGGRSIICSKDFKQKKRNEVLFLSSHPLPNRESFVFSQCFLSLSQSVFR